MTATDAIVAGPSPPPTARLRWMTAEVREVVEETPRVRSLVLHVPDWSGHRAGQHVDVRLTGEDGYQAQRSYSIASAPGAPHLMLTVERIDDGEVSPYLASEVRPGDRFELRGPVGGYFVWTIATGGPLVLIAGGSGIVPLMAMLRHRSAAGSSVPASLLYSSRTFEDIIYRAELDRLVAQGDTLKVMHTLTRSRPAGWTGGQRRIDREMLASVSPQPGARPRIFICGPTSLVESAARSLLEIGHEPNLVKTERFGPTGTGS
ncbi:MAG: oxidoreductase [Proteobacteria bacterium]|nr:MAG: oxidoreductase [Pseudomonadota bacterium]